MASEPILQSIARKEQELRAQLVLARAEAGKLIADARSAAEQLRAEGEAAGAAEASAWLLREERIAREEAAAALTAAEAEWGQAQVDATRLQAAADIILEAVLLTSSLDDAARGPTTSADGAAG